MSKLKQIERIKIRQEVNNYIFEKRQFPKTDWWLRMINKLLTSKDVKDRNSLYQMYNQGDFDARMKITSLIMESSHYKTTEDGYRLGQEIIDKIF